MCSSYEPCPNCGYRYIPPRVPINLDWTQWQDITWYDDQGRPMTYPKYQTWFDDGTYIYRAHLSGEIMRGKHDTYLQIKSALLSDHTDAYVDRVLRPTARLIKSLKGHAISDYPESKPVLDRIFGSRQNWESILTEFTDYCTQLVEQCHIAKGYGDAKIQVERLTYTMVAPRHM